MAYNTHLDNNAIQHSEQVRPTTLSYNSFLVPYWSTRGNVFLTDYLNDKISIISQDTVSSSELSFLDSVINKESMLKRTNTDFLKFNTKIMSEEVVVATDKRINVFTNQRLSKVDAMVNIQESNNQVLVEMLKASDQGLLLGYGSMMDNYYGIATNPKANNVNVGALTTGQIIDSLLTLIQGSVLTMKANNTLSNNDILIIIGKTVYRKLTSTFVGTSSNTTLFEFLKDKLLDQGINILINDQDYGLNMVNVVNLSHTYAYLSTLPRLDITAQRPDGSFVDQHDGDAIKYHFLFSPINFRAKDNFCVYNYNNISFS